MPPSFSSMLYEVKISMNSEGRLDNWAVKLKTQHNSGPKEKDTKRLRLKSAFRKKGLG